MVGGVILKAPEIEVSGSIIADGEDGNDGSMGADSNDGTGGGGGIGDTGVELHVNSSQTNQKVNGSGSYSNNNYKHGGGMMIVPDDHYYKYVNHGASPEIFEQTLG